MSNSAAKRVVPVGADNTKRDIVVSEMTVVQMRQLMMLSTWPGDDAAQEDLTHYQLDNYLFDDCRLCDLAFMANLSKEEISQLTGSELRKLRAKAKELNPDFFSALERMAAARSNS